MLAGQRCAVVGHFDGWMVGWLNGWMVYMVSF